LRKKKVMKKMEKKVMKIPPSFPKMEVMMFVRSRT
jgi:hypothetical protein